MAQEEEALAKNPGSLRERALATSRQQKIIIEEIQKLPKLLDEVHQLIEEDHDRFIVKNEKDRGIERSHDP